MTTPLISVLMGVCNGEQYLTEALDSILGQTLGDFEFIIVDDGSTDGTSSMLARYAASDPRVRVLRLPHMGLTRCLIAGLEQARGRFIARMDADDVSMPHRFARQSTYLNEHPEVVAVSSAVTWVDPEGWPIRSFSFPQTHEDIMAAQLEGLGGHLYHPAAMIRREAMLAGGGYRADHATSQDLDLWFRLAELGRLANLPDVLLRYRLHFKSVNITHRREQAETCRRITNEARARRGLPKLETPVNVSEVSELKERRRWVRWAVQSGYYRTARKHARWLICRAPWNLEAWRLWLQAWRLGWRATLVGHAKVAPSSG